MSSPSTAPEGLTTGAAGFRVLHHPAASAMRLLAASVRLHTVLRVRRLSA